MAFNINDFKSRGLTNGGARPSLFQVSLIPPFTILAGVNEKFTFTCSATEVPAASIESIDVGYFGRKIKLAGDRTFADWSVQVMNDEDYSVRNMFEQWSNLMNTYVGNLKQLPGNSYKSSDAVVTQYSKDGGIIKQYKFVGIFPTSIDRMQLSWDATNQIQTFDVTFSYDYWVPYTADGTIIDTGEIGSTSLVTP